VVPENHSSVLAEVTCNLDDSIWKKSDQELIEQVIGNLSDLKLIKRDEVCYSRVCRTEYAYVVSDLAYRDNLRIVTKYFKELGIGLVGRFAEFKYLNMDGCVDSAISYVKENYSQHGAK
jgi:protoporphyrinogen oxidase